MIIVIHSSVMDVTSSTNWLNTNGSNVILTELQTEHQTVWEQTVTSHQMSLTGFFPTVKTSFISEAFLQRSNKIALAYGIKFLVTRDQMPYINIGTINLLKIKLHYINIIKIRLYNSKIKLGWIEILKSTQAI